MQVDRTNFQSLFPQILNKIQQADFVAFDCQFTGLVTKLQRIEGLFSNHIQFYQRIKETALNFRIIQLGLAAFIYKDGIYEPAVYNFYISPDTWTRGYNNVMVCQVQSMEFLARNGIDFNRVFCKGIKSRRLYGVNDIQQKHQYNQFHFATIDNWFLSPEQQQYATQIQLNVVDKIINNYKVQKIVDFRNKTIFNYFRNKYYDMLFDKTKRNMKQFQYAVHFRPNHIKQTYYVEKQVAAKTVKDESNSNQNEIEKKNMMLEQKQKENIINQQIKKQSDNNLDNQKQVALQKKEEQNIKLQQPACLSKIFAAIISGRKPIVGHFPNLDIGLIFQTYLFDLPDTYQQFCHLLNQFFPQLYDTKVLSRRLQSKLKGLKVDLPSLFKACSNPRLLKNFSNFDLKGLEQYVSKEHEAGYDAFITGCSFIGMTNYLAGQPGRLNFKAIELQNMLLYSRYGGEIRLNGSGYSQNAIYYQNIIIIKPCKKQQFPQWKQLAKALSKFGSLIVHQDHEQIYYVFEQPTNINQIIKQFPEQKLKNYKQRRIIKARNMYKQIQTIVI